MNIEEVRDYCMSKPAVEETMPFGPDVLVFKVMGKMFGGMNLNWEDTAINLKCDPARAESLRDLHEGITPGYHMNKKHWNTVNTEWELEFELIHELIDHSYDLVVSKLPKAIKLALKDA